MNRVTAEDKIQDYVHVVVDGVPYCVSKQKVDIYYEGKDPLDLHMLLNSQKHRHNLAEKAHTASREASGSWSKKRQDAWRVHYNGKAMRIAWDGSLEEKVSSKASASNGKATRSANMLSELARERYNKDLNQLSDEELRGLMDSLQSRMQQEGPTAPQYTPSMSAPLAPGQSSASMWLRAAENPFAKDDSADDKGDKDDKEKKDKKDDGDKDKKEPKKDSPFDKPKSDSKPKDKPKPKEPGEKKDVDDGKKIIDMLEKLLKHEESEGEPHAKDIAHALDILKKFLLDEKSEPHAKDPMMGPGKVMPPIPGPAMPLLDKPKPPMAPVPPAGIPMTPAMSEWTGDSEFGFKVGDMVWKKSSEGEFLGEEPGRVIAFGSGKAVVDWGSEIGIPVEEDPASLVAAVDASDSSGDSLFGSSNREIADIGATPDPVDEKAEIERVMSGLSVRDLVAKSSPTESRPNSIVHVATGRTGEFVAKAADGRCLVNMGGEEVFLWPYEFAALNSPISN